VKGRGIQCAAKPPPSYRLGYLSADDLCRHLDWRNRTPTQYISLYEDFDEARREAGRRIRQPFVPGGARRFRESVQMVRVRANLNNNRVLRERELLESLQYFQGFDAANLVWNNIQARSECLIWGDIPEKWVVEVFEFL
jgi:hypothetical protein